MKKLPQTSEPEILDDSPVEALPSDTVDSYTPSSQPRKRGRPPGSGSKAKAQTSQIELLVLCVATLKGCSILIAWRMQYPVLLMSDKEASDIGKPLANIIGRTALAKVYGKYLRGSSDYIALGMALYAYGSRVWAQSQVLAAAGMAQKDGTNGHEPGGHGTVTGTTSASGPSFDGFVNLTPGRE